MIESIDHGAVRELRLNRPPANALDHDLVRALDIAVHEAPADGVQALILSGRPGMFCAGLDVHALLQRDETGMSEFFRAFFHLLRSLAESTIPLVAAMAGHAPAGGTVMAAFCDRRILAQGNYKMGFTEHQVGLPVPRPVLRAFEQICGPRVAHDYGLRGVVMNGEQALRIGLVDELVQADQVFQNALDWCTQLLRLPNQEALAATRRYARQSMIQAFAHLEQDVEEFTALWCSDQTQATLKALVAKLRAT